MTLTESFNLIPRLAARILPAPLVFLFTAEQPHGQNPSAPDSLWQSAMVQQTFKRAEEENQQTPPRGDWVPSVSKQELRILRGSWSEHAELAKAIPGRERREAVLLQRVGELAANLGRFDMAVLGIQQWLMRFLPGFNVPAELTLRTRGTVVAEMLGRCNAGEALALFSVLNAEVLMLMARREIAARNGTRWDHLQSEKAEHPIGPPSAMRDWFDYPSASDGELDLFTVALDREILTLAGLQRGLIEVTLLLKETLILQ